MKAEAAETIKIIIDRVQALNAVVPLHAIRSAHEHGNAIAMLNGLLDVGASDENSPLSDIANILGSLISDYEGTRYPLEHITPSATLRFLMDQHHLSQSDIPEIGNHQAVLEILNGKRHLNIQQVERLAKRFRIPAGVLT